MSCCHCKIYALGTCCYCRAKCKKYDQQGSIEETLQELERPAADDTELSGTEEDQASAMVQRTPSTVCAAAAGFCLQSQRYVGFISHLWYMCRQLALLAVVAL